MALLAISLDCCSNTKSLRSRSAIAWGVPIFIFDLPCLGMTRGGDTDLLVSCLTALRVLVLFCFSSSSSCLSQRFAYLLSQEQLGHDHEENER